METNQNVPVCLITPKNKKAYYLLLNKASFLPSTNIQLLKLLIKIYYNEKFNFINQECPSKIRRHHHHYHHHTGT